MRRIAAIASALSADWRQAIRTTVAAVLASVVTGLAGLPEGYWAVITCLVVMQGTLGATLSAGLARVRGTVAGALAGAAAAWLGTWITIPVFVLLGVVVLPLALLAARDARYRMAPVTAALLLMAIPSGNTAAAVHRVEEIVLGGAIGAMTALCVLPARGALGARVHGAEALRVLGELMRSHLSNAGNDDAATTRLQQHISGMEAAENEAAQERQFRLSGEMSFAPLIRTIRRLRTDIAMVGRVVATGRGTEEEHAALTRAIPTWLDTAAQALHDQTRAPDLAGVDDTGAVLRVDTALHLAFTILRRDLGDLADRIAERAAVRDYAFTRDAQEPLGR